MEIYKNLQLEDLNGEIWKEIKNFSEYMVSNLGRVKRYISDKRNHKCKILKQKLRIYLQLNLKNNNNIYQMVQIHRLVYENFISELTNDEYVHHIDENKLNNNINNLFKMKKDEHQKFHSVGQKNYFFGKKYKGKYNPMFGRNRSGEKNGNNILTEKQIHQIHKLSNLNFKNIDISRIYNTPRSTISNILNGRSWKYIYNIFNKEKY